MIHGVIPAQAGIHGVAWTPAFAGMTSEFGGRRRGMSEITPLAVTTHGVIPAQVRNHVAVWTPAFAGVTSVYIRVTPFAGGRW